MVISQSVVCDNVEVKAGVRLNKQCVLAYNVSQPTGMRSPRAPSVRLTLLWSLRQVVIGPNTTLPEGTVISMYHPEEEEEEDEDEFLSDDAKVGHSKDQAKVKGACWADTKNTGLRRSSGNELGVFLDSVFNPAEVGAEGKGCIWKASNLDDTEDEELSQCLWGRTAEYSKWKCSQDAADLIRTASLVFHL